jgi:TolB-like protein/Tfp pilus assembly protein PilF
MGADEEGTLGSLNGHRREHVDPCIVKHRGRIVKTTGDGLLAEFGSVVDAVRCAIEVQTGMAERNAEVAGDRRLEFRIGINVGDIVEQGGDIFGDGVNIAARLEGIAKPGGICVSGRVQEDAEGKIPATFEDMGETALKNIARPVRAYRLQLGGAVSPHPSVSAAPGLPDRPSLAVLPFQNMSGDAEQDYFADGVVEDIITALSRFKSFAVVARNSSFVYKGRAVDVRQVAKELGVRYVLEGSVRRAGTRLRITAQLIETESGTHLWAQNFDGAVEDVFDVQDRITENVVAIVEPRVARAEIERARRKPPDNLDAYDLYLQAMPDVYAMRPEANANAIRLLEQAVVLDPGFAPGVAMAGMAYLARITMQLPGASDSDTAACLRHARAALAIGSDDASVLCNCGFLLLEIGLQYEDGFALLKRALAENPNNVGALTNMGIACLLSGDLEEGVIHLERAIKLNPNDIGTHWQLTGIAHIRMAQGRYEEALEVASRSLGVNGGYDATFWMLIAANAYLGRVEVARRYVAALQALSPGASLSRIRRGQHAKDPHRIDVLIEGMRMAGMPEA